MAVRLGTLRRLPAWIGDFIVNDAGEIRPAGRLHRAKVFFNIGGARTRNKITHAAVANALRNAPRYFALQATIANVLGDMQTDATINVATIREIIKTLDRMSTLPAQRRAVLDRVTSTFNDAPPAQEELRGTDALSRYTELARKWADQAAIRESIKQREMDEECKSEPNSADDTAAAKSYNHHYCYCMLNCQTLANEFRAFMDSLFDAADLPGIRRVIAQNPGGIALCDERSFRSSEEARAIVHELNRSLATFTEKGVGDFGAELLMAVAKPLNEEQIECLCEAMRKVASIVRPVANSSMAALFIYTPILPLGEIDMAGDLRRLLNEMSLAVNAAAKQCDLGKPETKLMRELLVRNALSGVPIDAIKQIRTIFESPATSKLGRQLEIPDPADETDTNKNRLQCLLAIDSAVVRRLNEQEGISKPFTSSIKLS